MGSAPEPARQPSGSAAPQQIRFSLDDLGHVRQATARWAAAAGLPAASTVDWVIAVHEIAANAVVHGSPEARLTLRIGRGNTAEAVVRDEGRWLPSAAEAGSGQHRGMSGMGLPLARKVCDAVVIDASDSGTTVILRMRLGPRQPPGPLAWGLR